MPTSVSELEAMYGVGNPLAYGQAQEQQGLSNIVQQQEAAQAQQKTQANSLANMFTEANNPNLLRKNAADAQGQEFKNMSEGVKGRNSLATEGLQLDDEKRKYLLNASDTDIKLFANKAQQMAYSNNPQEAAKGAKLMQLSQAAQQLRQNHEYEKEKQTIIRDSAERIAAGNNAVSRANNADSNATSRYGTDQRAALAKDRQGSNKTVQDKLAKAPTFEHRIGIYEGAAHEASMAGDDALATYYQQMGQRERQALMDKVSAGAIAGQAGKPSMSAMGIETNGMPTPASVSAPLPGVNRSNADLQPAAKPPPPNLTLEQVQAQYPYLSKEELTRRYKRTFGVDLK